MADITRARTNGTTLLRIVVGLIFFAHGYAKCCQMGINGVAGFFGSIGVPAPGLMSYVITALELGGGIMLIAGLLTRLVAFAFVFDMLGAIFFAKKTIEIMSPNGIELEVLLLASCVTLVLVGPGWLSIDDSLRRRGKATPATTPAPASTNP